MACLLTHAALPPSFFFLSFPRFEARADDPSSNAYNANIMEQTVRWAMLDQLRSPPEYFADVITSHFRERGTAVLGTVRGWVDWCKSKGHTKEANAMQRMLPDLEKEIEKLGEQ